MSELDQQEISSGTSGKSTIKYPEAPKVKAPKVTLDDDAIKVLAFRDRAQDNANLISAQTGVGKERVIEILAKNPR